jgi:hypothetical protein
VLNRVVIGFIEMNKYEQCPWNSLIILPTDSISLFYFYFINTSGVLFIYILCKYRHSKTSLRWVPTSRAHRIQYFSTRTRIFSYTLNISKKIFLCLHLVVAPQMRLSSIP